MNWRPSKNIFSGKNGMRCNCSSWNEMGSTHCDHCGVKFDSPHQEGSVADKKVHVVEVERHDGPIMLPDKLTYKQAAEVLMEKAVYDEQPVAFSEVVPVFVWDGAVALDKAIRTLFGLSMQIPDKSFFGDIPPRMISVETGVDETTQVPWGKFSLPGIKGHVETSWAADSEGRIVFQIAANVLRKHEHQIKDLFRLTRELATKESLYRNKAFSIKFRDSEGDWLQIPVINFFRIVDNPPIFSKNLERAIETSILTPIRYTALARQNNIPLKRGILLAGPYGTGKTLTAGMIARECPQNGWTFIYVQSVHELAHALKFAQMFQPAVVFCEDVDRVADMNRSEGANDLLNVLDGVDTKVGEIITVLTSNHADKINPALRRKGRIDVTLSVSPPDKEAAERLIRYYGGPLVAADEDLSAVSERLDGQIPAIIREVVERAKLEAMNRSGGTSLRMSGGDLDNSAETLMIEEGLFRPNTGGNPHEMVAKDIARSLMNLVVR